MSLSNKQPLVSAIISTYNSEFFIKDKIEDLLNQTIGNDLEIIIVNSGSKQNEDTIVQSYIDQYSNITYIKTIERETIYKAWNRGIRIAKGKYITNANTDDRLKNDAYQILTNILEDNTDVALVYADQFITHIPNQTFEQNKSTVIEHVPDFDPIVQLDRCIVGSQPLWRASLHWNDDIWFDESYEVSGDHEFELNISQKYKMHHHHEVLGTFYKSRKTNKSYENIERNRNELRRLKHKYVPNYINQLPEHELVKLLHTFIKYVKIPISAYLAYHKYKALRSSYKTFYSLEFIYYFVGSILNKLEKHDEAKKYCEKYLRRKDSPIIEELYNSL